MFGRGATKLALVQAIDIQPDELETPIGVGLAPTHTENDETARLAPLAGAPIRTELKTITLRPGVPLVVASVKPYRRTVTIMRVGAAMEFQLSFLPPKTVQAGNVFDEMAKAVIASTTLAVDVVVEPGQQLWAAQYTVINHDISIHDAFRGPRE